MKKFLLISIVISLLFIGLSNCATTENRVWNGSDAFHKILDFSYPLYIGMPKSDIVKVWRYPTHTRTVISPDNTFNEIWIYRGYYKRKFQTRVLIFDGDLLIDWYSL